MFKCQKANMDKELDSSRGDYIATIAKASLGAIPVVGSLLAELAGSVIPNQRIDRLTKFARQLEARLGTIEQSKLAQQFADPDCADLIEESMRQAASAVTDERQNYIATLLAKSLTYEEVSHQESKHLLKILGDLSDAEIIWLRSYLDTALDEDIEFRELHAAVLKPPVACFGASQPDIDGSTIAESYKNHLARLGLLQERFKLDSKTNQLKVDRDGVVEKNYPKITLSGRLLLRLIGLSK